MRDHRACLGADEDRRVLRVPHVSTQSTPCEHSEYPVDHRACLGADEDRLAEPVRHEPLRMRQHVPAESFRCFGSFRAVGSFRTLEVFGFLEVSAPLWPHAACHAAQSAGGPYNGRTDAHMSDAHAPTRAHAHAQVRTSRGTLRAARARAATRRRAARCARRPRRSRAARASRSQAAGRKAGWAGGRAEEGYTGLLMAGSRAGTTRQRRGVGNAARPTPLAAAAVATRDGAG